MITYRNSVMERMEKAIVNFGDACQNVVTILQETHWDALGMSVTIDDETLPKVMPAPFPFIRETDEDAAWHVSQICSRIVRRRCRNPPRML